MICLGGSGEVEFRRLADLDNIFKRRDIGCECLCQQIKGVEEIHLEAEPIRHVRTRLWGYDMVRRTLRKHRAD